LKTLLILTDKEYKKIGFFGGFGGEYRISFLKLNSCRGTWEVGFGGFWRV
jgi:hypothetical protein